MRAKPTVMLAAATVAAMMATQIQAAETLPVSAPTDLASLLEGEFTTLPAPIDQANAASQPQTAAMMIAAKRVNVPALGPYVVYAELRQGATDGKMRQQRLYVLRPEADTGRIAMTAYTLSDPQAAADLYANPQPLANLKPVDLKQLPAGCEVLWRRVENGFAGDIATDRCDLARAGGDHFPPVGLHVTVSKEGIGEAPKDAAAGSGSSSSSASEAGVKPVFFRRLR